MIHTAKRAIILAAGFGQRLRPLTLTVPKPLIKVNGIRMIDTIVEALKANGIDEIYVVVGHLKEKFIEWSREHNEVSIVENPFYNTCNNISSLYVARDHLEDCFVIDGDQIIFNRNIVDKHFDLSGYNAVWTEEKTAEWLLDVQDGIVRSCSRTGGINGWQLYGISRWCREDGIKLKEFLEIEFIDKRNIGIYWDDIPMFLYPDKFKIGITVMNKEDVIEIDNLDELKKIDSSYNSAKENRNEE